MVRAVLPTPPSPSTTNLYKVIFPAILTGRGGCRLELWKEESLWCGVCEGSAEAQSRRWAASGRVLQSVSAVSLGGAEGRSNGRPMDGSECAVNRVRAATEGTAEARYRCRESARAYARKRRWGQVQGGAAGRRRRRMIKPNGTTVGMKQQEMSNSSTQEQRQRQVRTKDGRCKR
jgi:hypothetical protein